MYTEDTKQSKLLIRVSEAAERLSIARSKAYLMAQTGELPVVRLGKSIRVPVKLLDEWVEQQIAEGGAASK
jgi:excisionase family DNA binding protein